jgi:hypothetical protein
MSRDVELSLELGVLCIPRGVELHQHILSWVKGNRSEVLAYQNLKQIMLSSTWALSLK